MESKFYVSLEAARLLKEKEYDRECDYYIEEKIYGHMTKEQAEKLETKFPCPTKAEAIDWLESKGFIIELAVTFDLCHWVFSIYMKGREAFLTDTNFDFDSFTTRLEAEDAAIIKTLELL